MPTYCAGGVHLFAGLRKLFGSIAWPPKSLRAFAHLTHPRLAPLDTLHAILSLTDTVRGTVAISYGSEVDVDPSRPLVTVYGSAGTLEVLQGAQWTFRTRRSGNELVPEEETFEVRGVREEVDAFARAIVTGEWASCEERTGPCKALVDLAMVEACISSAERAES
jgi:predicted dehydrogenase